MFNRFSRNAPSDLQHFALQQIPVVHPDSNEIPSYAQGYSANNVYPGFPPLMADGRSLVACWQPEAVENEELIRQAGITSNWEYRKYMTSQADKIMQRNFHAAANDMGYYVRGEEPQAGNFSPMFSPYTMTTKELSHPMSDLQMDYVTNHGRTTQSPVLTEQQFRQLSGKGKPTVSL